MRTHHGVKALLQDAEHARRCAIGEGDAMQKALRRRFAAKELVRPYPNCYADAAYWANLNAEERSLHIIRALATKHKTWVFAGISAACLHGYQHSYTLHDGSVTIASNGGHSPRDHESLRRIPMTDIPKWRTSQGILMTSPARTLIDCAAYPFVQALPIYDSALRTGKVTAKDVRSTMAKIRRRDDDAVATLLRHADPRSENGGESMLRAHILTLSYAAPELQAEFTNPDNPAAPYRVDCCWRLADGQILVMEYDGMAKYADTSNPNRASLQAKMDYARRRDQHLWEQGVSGIVHVFYEDIMQPQRLEHKLMELGVPQPTGGNGIPPKA
ncbi:hypothetical protein JS531_05645 [Bifidobacterium sp. CP2]|uniref:hypothetical protein n=1 Tax=Bifidobacterium sp. CP2 TaxID=2809025 RepID=UPI001BDDB20D|nr:hypothetical protein [Bifidobacterium sp. CP2]MBT1181454.1 hypothetical protein [Bifidobacterium sp. CP2]